VLLVQKSTYLYSANKKIVKKYNRSTKYIFCENNLTVKENIQPIQQPNSSVAVTAVESYTQNTLSITSNQSAARAPSRYSGCREIGHRINIYINHYI